MIRRFFLALYFVMVPTFCIAGVEQIARHEQQGFAQKVDTYVNAVKNRCEGNVEITALLAKSMQLQADSYMRTVASQVSLIGPQLIRNKTADEREMCCAALLKMVMPIVEQFNQEMFKNLHEIDRCLEYWEYQRVHPVYYFSHKSPIKHFTLGQSEEVREKIQFLKEEQQYQYALLGKIHIHLSTFDVHSSVSEKYEWVHQGCSILFSYDTGLIVSKHAELFPLLSEATHVVYGYHKYMMKRLYKYYIPNVLVRKWLYVAGAAAGLGFGAPYAHKHREDFVTNANKMKQSVRKEASNHFKGMKNALLGNENYEKSLLNRYKELVRKFNLLKIKFAETSPDTLKNEVYKDALWGSLPAMEEIDGIQRPDAALVEQMSDYVMDDKIAMINKVCKGIAKASERLKAAENDGKLAKAGAIYDAAGDVSSAFKDDSKQEKQSPNDDNKGRGEQKEKTMATTFGDFFMSPDDRKQLKNVADTVLPTKQSSGDNNNNNKDEKDEKEESVVDAVPLYTKLVVQEHRMLLAIMKLTPYVGILGGTCFGAYMLYKKIRGVPNYDSVRSALIDIALLLNVYGDAEPEDMDECDFGKLSYLVYKLQFEEGRVPKQYRSSFLTEVALLKTARLTADQKMKTIELLFKKYPFLASQGTVVT